MFSTALLAAATLIPVVNGHATKYPTGTASTDTVTNNELNCHEVQPILSYHTHIVYIVTDEEQTNRAMELRDEARTHFASYLGKK